jgi:hypothetical protein
MEDGLKMARRVGSYTHRWAEERDPSSLVTWRGGGRKGKGKGRQITAIAARGVAGPDGDDT